MTTKPALLGALAKALPELESAKKNKANPAFKGTKYADLSAVIDALEPLIKHGLWYRQVVHENPDGIAVETFYIHESGEELSAGSLPMPASKRDAQGFGSALTYARRYSLQAAFGLATEDDDGNAAVKTKPASEAVMPDAEWSRLVGLIEATKANTGALIKHYAVDDLRQLNQEQYGDCLAKLNAKLAKLAKSETNKEAESFGEVLADEIPY